MEMNNLHNSEFYREKVKEMSASDRFVWEFGYPFIQYWRGIALGELALQGLEVYGTGDFLEFNEHGEITNLGYPDKITIADKPPFKLAVWARSLNTEVMQYFDRYLVHTYLTPLIRTDEYPTRIGNVGIIFDKKV